MIFYVQRGYDSNLFIHKCNLFQELSTQYVQFCGLCGAIFRAIVIDLIGVIHNEFSSTAKRKSCIFKEMTTFSCGEAFPGSRAFLQNTGELT